ncbi:MAG: Asp-tRNA(Asn)/Glu-tRNA(Gln) amidotransferase subunit GatA [Candidatus Sungbacteria bacterium]|uniref:Glutamyl-tRNA(Gln) amidotransferase subunit A n=1 Tax=Candidatus Sungiibacteriota bacterium TaxID=2750080 RepID=A0A9D6LSU1_9BACT|nr:Asp-tRNA(Asn)/Glu-tRNA(Gln) amidotransferase subunit GatA [Candidatus Sungbacteria bacterium]
MASNQLTIQKLRRGIAEKKFSVSELARDYLKRAKADPFHSFLLVDEDNVMSRARELEREPATDRLFGVPIAVKDNILVRGLPATAGSKILEPYIAAYDATVTKKIKAAGALILGKTNLDEFAMGSSTENSAFGATKNPHDSSRVPGGSSGGSAAAVAGDLAVVALGSDTGGSIRQPAALTGVIGFKPTYGRVSRHGLIAMASSLDQIGTFAKTVEDARTLYQVIEGPDRYDSTSVDIAPTESQEISLAGVRLGVPREYFSAGLDRRVGEAVKKAIAKFEKEGAHIIEISLAHSTYALAAYYVVMPAEVSANLARFDGLRYGYHAEKSENLLSLYKNTRDEGFGAEVKRRVMIGTYVLSHGYYDAYYVKAQKVRRLIRDDFAAAFRAVDVIMGPTTPSIAFKFGAKGADPVSMYLEDVYTVSINLAGLPALSLSCGLVAEEGKNLPVGLQIIGNWFDEGKLFAVAGACEKVLTG